MELKAAKMPLIIFKNVRFASLNCPNLKITLWHQYIDHGHTNSQKVANFDYFNVYFKLGYHFLKFRAC